MLFGSRRVPGKGQRRGKARWPQLDFNQSARAEFRPSAGRCSACPPAAGGYSQPETSSPWYLTGHIRLQVTSRVWSFGASVSPAATGGRLPVKPLGSSCSNVDGQDGIESLAQFERAGKILPQTLMAHTGRGSHLYFLWPEGLDLRNSAGRLAVGLDVRAEGGYVIVPPSVHPTGAAYEFIDERIAVAAAPQCGRCADISRAYTMLQPA